MSYYSFIKKNVCFFIIILIVIPSFCFAQSSLQKAAENAFLITRMAEKFHVQPRSVDDAFSHHVFSKLFSALDNEKIIFTQKDIDALHSFNNTLDDEIKQRKTIFLQKILSVYKKQIVTVDSLLTIISKKPFNFSIPEKLTTAEDTSFSLDNITLQQKLAKYCKVGALNYIANYYPDSAKPLIQKKFVDSIEPIARKKIISSVKRSFTTLLEQSNAAEKELIETYCNTIAEAYDPHSSFFSADAKTSFENQLGKKPLRFGFALDEEEDGSVAIADLKPGSTAYKSGMLNAGDKILTVQWEGKELINVEEKGSAYLSDLLDGNTTEKLTLTIKKADGSTKSVVLQKQEIDNGEDDSKVKSFILKGIKTIGYISLPAFYEDWDVKETGVNGAANDIGKEILKLKKENIQGLIIDVRYNGGGSMQEAVELAGIFIDVGPVGQVKSKEAKVYTLKDINRGTLYDGPLIVLVNGYSASASEMFAGTLQDYNRAIIVGTPTFGKATAQVILPLDTTISLEDRNQSIKADAYVKLTISSLYRITGKTAQNTGVLPDIVLPDLLSVTGEREVNQPFSLVVSNIEANKYYKPYPALNLKDIQAFAQQEVTNSSVFTAVQKSIEKAKNSKLSKDISLLLTDFIANHNMEMQEELDEFIEEEKSKSKSNYSITNTIFDSKRIQLNTSNDFMNEQWVQYLTKDPYIKTAYQVLVKMIMP